MVVFVIFTNFLCLCECARLQSRCNQQVMELKRREQHTNRMREKLSQLTDRQKYRNSCEISLSINTLIHAMFEIN